MKPIIDGEMESCGSDRIMRFMATYCAVLLGCGATCIRLEKNSGRIAERFGFEMEITIFPRHLLLTLRRNNDSRTEVVTVRPRPISYNINTLLSELSWDVSDNRLSLAECERRLEAILRTDHQKAWVTLLLVPIANASFCRLFGGDIVAMAVVWLSTLAGYYTKQTLVGMKMDPRGIFLICSFVSTIIASADALFHLGSTPGLAVGASVLYLVPGIPFLNSFSDLLNRHYICAFSRFADAVVLTACLSIGIGAGMLLMNLSMF